MKAKGYVGYYKSALFCVIHVQHQVKGFRLSCWLSLWFPYMERGWLIGNMTSNDSQDPALDGMRLLLLLDRSRVEVAILLNEFRQEEQESKQEQEQESTRS